jgi:hypothetical protein
MLNEFCKETPVKWSLHGRASYFMMRACLLLILLSCNFLQSVSQDRLGQEVTYHVDAFLDTSDATIKGLLKAEYKNNTPVNLREIHFHLYPNAYRDRETALTRQLVKLGHTDLFFADDSERGYIDSLNFNVNGDPMDWKLSSDNPDIAVVKLFKELLPNESLTVETSFRVKLPDARFSRLGQYNGTYYLTNWFPEIAVFNEQGWQSMPYLEQGEFYSEFANYKIDLTVPSSFKIASTGRCLSENCHEPLNASGGSRTDLKTIKLRRDSVHSFAVFISNDFSYEERILSLPGSGKIMCKLYHTDKNAPYYDSAFAYIERSLTFLTGLFGPYPYDEFTIADGRTSGGVNMEYPCITLIQSPESYHQLEQIIVHEMSHMWNYAAVRFNERSDPWFDEGLSMFSELRYFDVHYPGNRGEGINDYMTGSQFLNKHAGIAELNPTEAASLEYLAASRLATDLPPSLSSELHTNTSYGNSVYVKSGLSWYLLYNSVGHDLFSACIQKFIDENKFRLCDKNTLKSSMETCLDTDLNWFFTDLIGNDAPVDISIVNANDTILNLKTTIEHSVPVNVKDRGTELTTEENGQWSNSQDWQLSSKEFRKKRIIEVSTIPLPDLRPADNKIKADGKRPAEYKLKFFSGNGLYTEREIYWLPVVGYNEYNGLMPGLSLHNHALVPRTFEFDMTPLFDPGNNFVGGISNITRVWRMKHARLSMIRANLIYKRFLYDSESVSDVDQLSDNSPLGYDKISLSADLGFTPEKTGSTISNMVSFSHHSVLREVVTYEMKNNIFIPERDRRYFGFQSATWTLKDRRTLDPYSTSVRVENGDEYMKLQIELNYRFSFAKPTKGLDVRFHFGKFLFNDQQEYNYNFRMDGWTGSDDYLFNDYYFGRTETSGVWSRQFLLKDGAFKVPTAVGQSNNWNCALNIQVDNPTPMPVRFFIDIGTYAGIQDVFDDLNNVIMYDAGVCISIGKGAFEVYLPLFISKDIEQELEINDRNSLSDRIRFVFDIKKLSPLRLRNKVHGVYAEY